MIVFAIVENHARLWASSTVYSNGTLIFSLPTGLKQPRGSSFPFWSQQWTIWSLCQLLNPAGWSIWNCSQECHESELSKHNQLGMFLSLHGKSRTVVWRLNFEKTWQLSSTYETSCRWIWSCIETHDCLLILLPCIPLKFINCYFLKLKTIHKCSLPL